MRIPESWRHRRSDFLAVAVLAAATLLVFWKGLAQPAEIIREDAASYYQPYYTFAADEVKAGRFPLWNPYTQMGIPFHAGLQAALLYPLRWPMFGMDYVHGYVVELCLHYFLTGLAAYLLMRGAVGVGPPAGLIGALGIALGGFALGHMSHLNYFQAYPWFLLTILFLFLAVDRARWTWAVPAGACVGMMGLIGAVHLLLLLGIFLFLFVIYHTATALVRRLREKSAGWGAVVRPGAVTLGAMVLGGLISAAQMLPAQALSGRSIRGQLTWDYVNWACAEPTRNAIQMVVPFYYGNCRLGYWGDYLYYESAHYVGIVLLLGAVVSLALLGRKKHLWFWLTTAAVGAVIAAGAYLPVYRVLFDHVPIFSQLRNPTRIFWIAEIALACLGAAGIDHVLSGAARGEKSGRSRTLAVAAGAAAIAVLAGCMISLAGHARDPQAPAQWAATNPRRFFNQSAQAAAAMPAKVMEKFDLPSWGSAAALVVGVAAFLIVALWRRPARPWHVALLVTVTVADLLALSAGMIMYDPLFEADRPYAEAPPRAAWLQKNLGLQRYLVVPKPSWIEPDAQIVQARGMQWRIRDAGGKAEGIMDSLPRLQFCAAAEKKAAVLAVAGVRYVFSRLDLAGPILRQVWQDSRYKVYENMGCLPPAFFVRDVVTARDSAESLRRLAGADPGRLIDPRTTAVVVGAPPPETAPSKAARLPEVKVAAVPGRWEIQTEADAPAQLVISEGYDPGWRCRIGEQAVAIYQTDDQIMSVPVPAGRQTVVLTYEPPEFRLGIWLSVAGVLAACAAPVAGRFVRKRRPAKLVARPLKQAKKATVQ